MMDEKKDYFVYTDKMTVGYNGEPLIRDIDPAEKRRDSDADRTKWRRQIHHFKKYYQTTDADCRNRVY